MKYKLTNNTKTVFGVKLYQIEALKCFGPIKSGQLGGWVQSESNLSHDGDAWVYGDACVYENARIYENAWVYGDSRVYGNACVYGNARVFENSRVYGCVNK